ncbi:hypothetical protein A9Q87_04925 [Flavobacteriales bacterium 34_180_T64]|nr:hypothetical protein A9Q87_04925 [Flavobacteriales bacterium 34_180_T64]
MKILKYSLLAIVLLSTISCFEDRDDNGILASDISDFVWKGMNVFYVYKDNVPDLANDRFSSNSEYGSYLNSFSAPEDLFESVIYARETVDRYSIILDDYIAFELLLEGFSKGNGLRYYSFANPQNSSERLLVIRQVIPSSPGDDLNLQRGQFYNQIDGVTLTADNISGLLSSDTYTLHEVDHMDNGTPETTDDSFVSNGTTVSITKATYNENPVHGASIIDLDGENLGYLNYNFFNASYNTQLNNAFGLFQSNNIQHLVIDLRYNPGGKINTATLLGSMVTGQHNGELFARLVYNSELQNSNTDYNFTNSFDGSTINSLSLEKVYVLTTGSSASASEMIINSLRPYIEVVQIGSITEGKSQASGTIYDSSDFGKTGANPNHTYALQPLIAITQNKNGNSVDSNGLIPDIALTESVYNLGLFGDVSEPYLAAAIADIQGIGRMAPPTELVPFKNETRTHKFKNRMYIDEDSAPREFRKQHFD